MYRYIISLTHLKKIWKEPESLLEPLLSITTYIQESITECTIDETKLDQVLKWVPEKLYMRII